ncbi:MAG: ABC transporter permease [Candidatus Melainabacteria bacterium]|nr:ABC transporter permease [Candidatus Melainabacteria bacterium]
MLNNFFKDNSFFWGFKAIVFKEIIHIINDRLTLSLSLLIPAIQLTIYGFAIDMDIKNIRSAVLDFDKTNYSKLILEKLQNSRYFNIKYFPDGEEELINNIVEGKVKAGFVIPKNFQANVLSNKPTSIQILVDGSDSTVAQQASNTASLIIQSFGLKITEDFYEINTRLIEPRTRVLFNPDLKSVNFMIPGLLGVIMQIITTFLTALSIVKEKEKGTLEQLMVTPIGQGGLLIGKLVPYAMIGFMQFFIVTMVMVFLFKVPIHGSIVLLFILSTIFLFSSLSLGLLISTAAENHAQATQLLQLVIIPSILLSGFIFSRENMPPVMSAIGYFIPLTYFLEILRGIILRGATFIQLIHDIIPLLLYGIIILYYAIKRFKKQIA